jgi:hypothetical protein
MPPPVPAEEVFPENVEFEIVTIPLAWNAPAIPVDAELLLFTVVFLTCRVDVEKFCIAPPELVDELFEITQLSIVRLAGTDGLADAALLSAPPFAAELPMRIELVISIVPPTL